MRSKLQDCLVLQGWNDGASNNYLNEYESNLYNQ